jgi:uncharacterized protein
MCRDSVEPYCLSPRFMLWEQSAEGIGLAWIALHPGRRIINNTEEQQARGAARSEQAQLDDVAVVARDGATLRAWRIRPAEWNHQAVVLLHGVSDNRLGVYGYADWLVRNHYSVLLPDARAHGVSGGAIATYGIEERHDVHRWVDWLEENEHPACVLGFGESMGAAEILESLSVESRFCAVVAESPFATFREVAYARFGQPFGLGPWVGRTFFRPTVEAGFMFAKLRFGLDMDSASPEAAVAKSATPILLIHGLADTNIPPYNSDLIHSRDAARIVVWHVEGAAHCGAHEVAPAEFEQRVLELFSSSQQAVRDRTSNQ